jgi:hypothetical protein
LSLGIEWLAAPLLLWRRSRPFVVAPLMGFHLLMWPLLALGSFPMVMLVALVVLLPGTFWDRLGWSPLGQTSESDTEPQHQLTRSRALAALMALAILTTAEGERVVSLGGGGGLALRRRSAGRAAALYFKYEGCLGNVCT